MFLYVYVFFSLLILLFLFIKLPVTHPTPQATAPTNLDGSAIQFDPLMLL